jgi:hypothetical protein
MSMRILSDTLFDNIRSSNVGGRQAFSNRPAYSGSPGFKFQPGNWIFLDYT